MITKRKNFNRYCCEDISLIENYEEEWHEPLVEVDE